MKKSDLISWGLLIACVFVLLEATLNGEGILFALLLGAALMFFGRKRLPRRSGKIMFWLGVFITVMNILSMYTFKLLLVAIVIYVIYEFYQSKQNPVVITPHVKEQSAFSQHEDLYKKEPLLKNMILGTQQTPEHVYEWNDINIQCGPGDSIIDLSQTILPKGEAVIMIRGFIGNITIQIPYEVETAVSHSVFVGNTEIFDQPEPKMFNQTLFFRTKGYGEAEKKVKIVTSLFAGSLEVKRV